MDTNTRRTTMSDQAPAADPALDALDRVHDAAIDGRIPVADDVRLIRDALADRVTPTEASEIIGWSEHADEALPLRPNERAIIARLSRIADREQHR
jgi:hypothetical protein